jgi:hypothetical protein
MNMPSMPNAVSMPARAHAIDVLHDAGTAEHEALF